MGKQVYLICPVRGVSEEQTAELDEYVETLESWGWTVHYPPRDVNQEDPAGGINIFMAHLRAMLQSDEVHIFWDKTSSGSHADLGMAAIYKEMAKDLKNVKIKLMKSYYADRADKSYEKVIRSLEER